MDGFGDKWLTAMVSHGRLCPRQLYVAELWEGEVDRALPALSDYTLVQLTQEKGAGVGNHGTRAVCRGSRAQGLAGSWREEALAVCWSGLGRQTCIRRVTD